LHSSSSTADGSAWLEGYLKGPALARIKVFANVSASDTSFEKLVVVSGQGPFAIQEEVVALLTQAFGDVALFFWNAHQGDKIGVLWKPSVLLTQKFSILQSLRIALDTHTTIFNTAEALARMIASSQYISHVTIR